MCGCRYLILFAFLMSAAREVYADPGLYFCTVEQAAGLHFNYKTSEWRPTVFKPGKMYLLRKLNDSIIENSKYNSFLKKNPKPSWAFFDGEMPVATCVENALLEELTCKEVLAEASFAKNSRRFELVYHGAYVNQAYWLQLKNENPKEYESGLASGHGDDANHPDDIVTQIGKCSVEPK